MRLMRIAMVAIGVLSCAMAAMAREEIAPLKSITIVAEAGKPWGNVTVQVTTEKTKDVVSVATITVTPEGAKAIEVPKEALAGLESPRLHTLSVRHEVGMGDGPWLCLRLRFGTPMVVHDTVQPGKQEDSDYAEAVIAIRDNKVVYRVNDTKAPGALHVGGETWKKVWEAK